MDNKLTLDQLGIDAHLQDDFNCFLIHDKTIILELWHKYLRSRSLDVAKGVVSEKESEELHLANAKPSSIDHLQFTIIPDVSVDVQQLEGPIQESTPELSANATLLDEPADQEKACSSDGALSCEASSPPPLSENTDHVDSTLPQTDSANSPQIDNTMGIFKRGADAPKKSQVDDAFQAQFSGIHLGLPNAKVNEAYRCVFDFSKLGLSKITEHWFEGFELIGLKYDPTTGLLEGVPDKAGDHKILLFCIREDVEGQMREFSRELIFVVNPDIRSLWKDIPTPKDILYYKEDRVAEVLRTPYRTMLAASARGRSHAHEGIPRDDDFKLSYQEHSRWHIAIVADGAGSAKYSRKGAQLACEVAEQAIAMGVAKVEPSLDDPIMAYAADKSDITKKVLSDALYGVIGAAAFEARRAIIAEAKAQGSNIKDYSTTLLLTISKQFEFGWFVASFWVGDGGIAIYTTGEKPYLKLLGEPDGGEFAGQTRFLTMDDIFKPEELFRRLRFDIVEHFTALILMTDGVTDPKFETDANLNRIEKWDALWTDLNKTIDTNDLETSESRLLEWLDFWSPGNHDDRTIALVIN